jgi:hypothetical protein
MPTTFHFSLSLFSSALCSEKESMGKSDLFFLGSFSPLVDLRVSTGVKIFCSPCGTREKNCEEIPEIFYIYISKHLYRVGLAIQGISKSFLRRHDSEKHH